MRFRLAVPGFFLQCYGWFGFFFHKSKGAPLFCLLASLLPALFIPNAVAQSSTSTPIFQFAAFYNPVLEINPGTAFTVSGRVHCNTNIYCTGSSSSQPLTFLDSVDAAGTVSTNPSPLDPQNYGKRNGHVIFPVGSPITNYDTLNLPLGTSATNYTYVAIEGLLQIPPPAYALGTAAAYTAKGQNYFANEADLIITNDATTGTNITVLYQNMNNSSNYLIKVLPDAVGNIVTNITITTNGVINKIYVTNYNYITNFYYSFVTNVTFYDYRETNTVRALQIDVAKLGVWLGNTNSLGGWQYELMSAGGGSTDMGHVINSIYVFNSIPLATGTFPAVRLVNGAQLPTNTCGSHQASGLGVATAQPIYVEGNYNVTTDGVHHAYSLGSTTNGCTLPACLIGDAVTLLSSNFVDNASGGTEDPASTQTAITLNAACFEGIVPSNGSYYSGGLENFLRLLENWGGDTVTYNGSIVVMFPSTYATNHWDGSYYGAPNRAWGFDTTFTTPAGLPPLTPRVVDNTTNPPVITTPPQSQIVAQGSNVTFNVTAAGFSPLSFQWKFDGTNISAATNTSLTLTNVQFSQAGNYAVLVTNAFGSIMSSNAVLTVLSPSPTILTQPTNQTVYVNDTATFGVTATGSLPLSYQWSFNGTDIDGATNALLTLTNVQLSRAGNYAVQVANAFGSTNSANAVLTVVALPPTIQTQPTNQTVFLNGAAAFTVVAGGTMPLSYQWNFNGTDIDGATNTTLTLTNVQMSQAGNYAVQVTNLFGSILSSNAVLTVIALPPTISSQPTDQTVIVGGSTIFSATAAGSLPLSCQWQFNGTDIVGATNLSLMLDNVSTNNEGPYQVIVTNAYGSVTSSIATLTVIRSLVVAWGNKYNVPSGLTNVVAIAAGSYFDLALQANGTVVAWGNNIVGQTNVPDGLTNVSAIAAGDSHSLALQADGTVVSWGYNDAGETKVPADLTNVVAIAAGTYDSLALQANGTVVAWGYNGYGQTNVPAGLTNVVAIAAGHYFSLALQANGTVVGWGLNLNGEINVPTGLTNVVAIAAGTYHSLALQANGTVVGWGYNVYGQTNVPTDLTNVVAIAAGHDFSLALQADGKVVGWGYGIYGTINIPVGLTNVVAIAAGESHSLALENDGSPVIIRQPTSQAALSNATVLFNVAAVGRPQLSYQWQKNGADLTDGCNVSGATTAALTLTNVQPGDAGAYTLIVTNDFGSIMSSNAVLTVLVPPSITTQPTGCTNVVGTTANFNVVADGTAPLIYQWQLNGTNLDGATNATLILSAVTVNQAGSYTVIVANQAGSVTSSNAVLSVYATAAAALGGCSFSCDNGFQFQVAGVPGFNYAVQESTNLFDWVSLITNASPFIFTDANATNFPQQFYRTLYVP